MSNRKQQVRLALAAVVSVILATWAPLAAAAPSARATVDTHLAAIKARDLETLLPTLTAGRTLTMIMPGGHALETRQQYVDFHRDWFASKDDGNLESEVVSVIESAELAHALVRYRYSSKDAAGKPQVITSWLALTFALEDGRWALVVDQNTPIETPAKR